MGMTPQEKEMLEREIALYEERARKLAADEAAAIDRAIKQHERFMQMLAATDAAELDTDPPSVNAAAWVHRQLGGTGRPATVKRYAASTAPSVRGFCWKGELTIYVRRDAGLRTVVHEATHLARPDLSEAEVRALARELYEEGCEIDTDRRYNDGDLDATGYPKKEIEWCS